ncbi:MAG: hypothetical protein J0M29_08950 [Chitinophagales bacterium]|nr:hypothetical protein [Chitinophagales bacterium]
MLFEPNVIYHIYNQGNNKELIFYKEENYLFFLKKTRLLISPYAEFLAYCLMPNHFHWLIIAKPDGCEWASHLKFPIPRQVLNHQINILLRSYGRAINNQEGRTGSLFRQHTKGKTGWEDPFVEASRRKSSTQGFVFGLDNQYAYNCFNYIHQNPVEANLVLKGTDWIYSSARDYAGIRSGTLCNQSLAKDLLNF